VPQIHESKTKRQDDGERINKRDSGRRESGKAVNRTKEKKVAGGSEKILFNIKEVEEGRG
jgi:hypothetical protein